MLSFAGAFVASYITILLKVFQQKNVVGNHYKAVFVTSNLLALSETAIVLLVVHEGWWLGVSTGIGAGLGACTGMFLHTKFMRRKV